MAQTIILACSLLLLAVLALSAAPRRGRKQAALEEAPFMDKERLREHLTLLALRSPAQGFARLPKISRCLRMMRRLLRVRGDLPALDVLRENSRGLLMPLMGLAADLRHPPRMPKTAAGPVRTLLLTDEFFRLCAHIDASALLDALFAWEKAGPMTQQERLAVPLCLRLTLAEHLGGILESIHADVREAQRGQALARRLIHARRPMALLTRQTLSLTSAQAMLEVLRAREADALLAAIDELMAEADFTAARLAEAHARRQTLLAGQITRTLNVLRTLDKIDWPTLEEASDPLHLLMLEDPSGTYPRMDRDSRALYRHQAAALAKIFRTDETRLVHGALTLAAGAEPDGLENHVGWYLLEAAGMRALHRHLRAQGGRATLFLRRHQAGLYRAALTVLMLAEAVLFLQAGHPLWLLPVFGGVAWAFNRFLINGAVRRLCPPRPLPRIQVDRVTEDARTLIVIPTILLDRHDALTMARRLLLARKAFPAGEIDCLLLCDYSDNLTQTSGEDYAVLAAGRAAIEAIDGDGGRCMYLHRRRSWDADQHCYIGRERKRGALETLNRLIVHGECADEFDEASVPLSFFHRRYAYVLTLDSDTTPAPDTLHTLIGTLSHPLNTRCRTAEGVRGVSILQPRMEVDPDTVRTPISLIEGGVGGVDPYGAGMCSLAQRLTGRGSFEGKGLYQPDALLEATEGLILPDTILSHDLLEGELAGCAQEAACAMYDGHPAAMAGWLRRLHRWTRGDWQLLPWLLPHVKTPEGIRRNPLRSWSRFKIRENLKRSLVQPCQLLLLLYAALTRNGGLALFAALGPELACLLPMGKISLARLAVRTVFLPLRAVIRADAAFRALWRSFVQRRHRLDWVTAVQGDAGDTLSAFENWSQGLAVTAFIGAALFVMPPGAVGLIFAAVFAVFPLLHPPLDTPLHLQPRAGAAMEASLIDIAETTWRYFEETVTPAEHHLPPDNVQVKPWRGPARRTSPTDIGMYLLSCLAARELGLIATSELTRRVSATMDTLEALPLWHGLPYNWYATDTLRVLEPPFISAVDCGNLCACLLAVAQGLRACLPETAEEFIPLSGRVDAFAAQMKLNRLYDPAAQLFFIGIDTKKSAPDQVHYDLYASEAQLTSFVAVMRREVPLKHFSMLNRTLVRAGRGTPYISWSGTAFEYLMPRLLLPVSRGTQMEHTLRAMLRAQMRRRQQGMWGISESGWWGFDAQLNYQYHAFGLPELALGPSAQHAVFSPYAAALCLPFAPNAAHDSLMCMRSRGMLGRLGFFESIDLDPAHLPEGTAEAMVCSHMAHHQGMLMCAICNLLTGGALTRHFMTIPEAAAFAPLLKEKRLHRLTLPAAALRPINAAPKEASFRRAASPLTAPVDAHLIGSPEAMLLTSAQGLGVMRSRGIDLTRFTGDPTQVEGIQFYLCDTGRVYRLTDPALSGETQFSEGFVRFTHQCGQLSCMLTAFTDPVQGAFLHRIEVSNLSGQERMIDLADCLVPELQSTASDHPAYSDLFIETARPEERVLSVTRRPKKEGEAPVTMYHAISAAQPLMALTAETDRMAFQGRNHTLHAPASLLAPMREGLVGAPITPCASFRARLNIPGRGRAEVIFATRLARPGEAFSLDALTPRPSDADTAMALSRLLSRTMTDTLALPQSQAAELSRLFGAILWGHQPHQGAVSPLTQPLSALHERGIGTHKPILLAVLHSRGGMALLRETAALAGWMLLMGQPITLCVLCEGDHAADARAAAEEFLAATVLHSRDRDCLRLITSSDVKDGVRDTLEAVARVILYEGAGTVTAQLEAHQKQLPALPLPDAPGNPPPLEAENLRYFNGLGGFQEQTDDYVIRLEGSEATPAPWCSLLTGERLGTLCMESGLNMTFAGNSHLRRLTQWSNDAVCPAVGEAAILRDEDSGAVFTPTPLPFGRGMNCRVQFSPGTAVWRSLGYGLDMTLNAAVIPGSSFGVRTLRLKNVTSATRRLTVCIAARFVMGRGSLDEALTYLTPLRGLVTAASPFMPQTGCLALAEGECLAQRMSPLAFLGLCGGMPDLADAPIHDESGSVALLTMSITLPAGGSTSVTWLLGACRQLDDLERTLALVREGGSSVIYRQARQQWAQRLQAISVSTPEDSLNLLMNRVLPLQVRTSRLEGRCGFYQAGGAIGFRDQLQDMTALVHTEPARVRTHLLLCARHQYMDGDVQHWWHPPFTGVRTRITDDRLFLPFMVCWYIRRTGDADILRVQSPWLQNAPIPPDAEDLYHTATPTAEQDTLYVHCLRALTSIRLGPRGLPVMAGGDWNDGMNRVRGESVWLAMFYVRTLKAFAEYADDATREEILSVRGRLMEAIDRSGWDGGWYRRAYFESGAPLGSADSPECRIDSLCQSWAVLALGVTERSAQAMENAWQQLYDPRLGIMKLLTPPFDGKLDAGYIGGYLSGIRENGGQYTHAAAWMVWALSELGWEGRAWELVRALNPIHHGGAEAAIARYRLEPYALAGDVYANPQQPGRGGWSHYTGSAAWLYTIILESLLGFEKRGDQVRLRPRVPPEWDDFTITLQLGSATWHFHAGRDAAYLTCDGEKITDGWITVRDDGRIHEVRTPIKATL